MCVIAVIFYDIVKGQTLCTWTVVLILVLLKTKSSYFRPVITIIIAVTRWFSFIFYLSVHTHEPPLSPLKERHIYGATVSLRKTRTTALCKSDTQNGLLTNQKTLPAAGDLNFAGPTLAAKKGPLFGVLVLLLWGGEPVLPPRRRTEEKN